VRAAIRGVPGVESVSAARNLPLMLIAATAAVHPERIPSLHLEADLVPAGPRYLETLRIPLLRGRDFTDLDLRYTGRTTSVIVNHTLAQRIFGTADPVGRTLVSDDGHEDAGRVYEIVGVARDAAVRSLDEAPHPVVYRPEVGDFYFVRVAGDAATMLRTVETAIARVEPNAWVQAQPLSAQVAFAKRPASIGSGALAALGAIGLAMAMVGLYAIVAHSVNRRTFEIGVRLALGATRAHVLALIMREGIGLVAIGCAIGVAAAVVLVRVVSSIVTLNQGRFDPLALGAASAATIAVGAAATLAPARRAARVDPVIALRSE
jgi:putative ABC transport system permease protein